METIVFSLRRKEISRARPPRVKLMEQAAGAALTPVERATLGLLKESGEARLDLLAERVASELCREEIRRGAWAVDLGLVGSALFIPEVVRSLKARDGILWKIITDTGRGDGVLSDLR